MSPVWHVGLLLTRHRINTVSLHGSLKFRSRLLVMLTARQIPLPRDNWLLPFPQLEKHRRPNAHEDGKKHRGGIVKQIGELCEKAGFVESKKEKGRIEMKFKYEIPMNMHDKLLISARLVARRTQCDVANSPLIAHLTTRRVVFTIHWRNPVYKAEESNNRRKHQHLCVKSEPETRFQHI